MSEDVLRKNNIDKSSKILVLCSSLLATFTFFVFGPFEIYLTNINEFWFNISLFWYVPVIVFIIIFLVLLIIGLILPSKIRIYYSLLITGLALAIYIQGNFINLDVGVLNGGSIDWGKYKFRIILNFAIWCFIIVLPSLIYLIFKAKNKHLIFLKGCYLLCCFIFVVQAVTLTTLFLTTDVGKQDDYVYVLSDKNFLNLSTDKNTVVFIADMFDDSYFKQILEETPEIEDEFKGFTYFNNSVGSYSTTKYTFSALLTNQYNRNSTLSYNEEINKEYENGTMFQDLINNDVKIDIYTIKDLEEAIPQDILNNSSNYIKLHSAISDYTKFTKLLYKLTGCKYAPDVFKCKYWMTGTEFEKVKYQSDGVSNSYSIDNINVYNKIKSTELTTSEDERFKLIHIEGSHYPYTIDENVQSVYLEMTHDNAVKAARGSLKIIQEYLDKMKEEGVYENSQIIIMGDHGFYWDGTLTNPLLLIKPVNSDGDFQISNAPISHMDFQATVMDSFGLNDNNLYGTSVFDVSEDAERQRLFYQYYLNEGTIDGKSRLIEYSVDSDNNLRKSFHLTDKEYTVDGELISHLEHCSYCQKYGEGSNDVDGEVKIIHTKK